MEKPKLTIFSILFKNEAAAVAHLEASGYPPIAIEQDGNGLIELIVKLLPDDEMFGLIQALPIHLSAKVGIVADDRPPFSLRHNA